jgi:lactoylglutathione lyase
MSANPLTPTLCVDHVMLPVSNLDRAVAFYTGVLSMKVVEARSDQKRKIAHVGYTPRGGQATIELIETLPPLQTNGFAVGSGHVCLRLNGLGNLCQRIQVEGGAFDRPLDRSGETVSRAWVRDPDGHLLELVESGAS